MKRTFLIITFVLCAAFLVGCQATPKKPVVIQKDQEQMIQKAQATDSVQVSPGVMLRERVAHLNIFGFVKGSDGKLIIKTNSAVSVPDVDAIPIIRVSSAGFHRNLPIAYTNCFAAIPKCMHPRNRSQRMQS